MAPRKDLRMLNISQSIKIVNVVMGIFIIVMIRVARNLGIAFALR